MILFIISYVFTGLLLTKCVIKPLLKFFLDENSDEMMDGICIIAWPVLLFILFCIVIACTLGLLFSLLGKVVNL